MWSISPQALHFQEKPRKKSSDFPYVLHRSCEVRTTTENAKRKKNKPCTVPIAASCCMWRACGPPKLRKSLGKKKRKSNQRKRPNLKMRRHGGAPGHVPGVSRGVPGRPRDDCLGPGHGRRAGGPRDSQRTLSPKLPKPLKRQKLLW